MTKSKYYGPEDKKKPTEKKSLEDNEKKQVQQVIKPEESPKKLEKTNNSDKKKGEKVMDEEIKREFGEFKTTLKDFIKEQKKQKEERQAKQLEEQQAKRLKAITDPLIKTVKEQGERLKFIGDMVCNEAGECRFPTKEEIESLGSPEEQNEIIAETEQMREHYRALTGKDVERPMTIVAGLTKKALGDIIEKNSGPEILAELVNKAIPQKVVDEIRKGKTEVKELTTAEKAQLAIQECASENAPEFCKILRDEGYNVQIKTEEGGGMLGSGYEDIE